MKKLVLLGILFNLCVSLSAQDVDYKKGMIQVDGKDYAKLEVKKKNFGLTKDFEVYSLSGKKLVIAVPATEFETDKSDNSTLYYRVTFLTADQVGIFKVNALSQEKSFAKLIGASGIIVSDSVDVAKVKEFIASKSASPVIAVDYTVVHRDRMWPIYFKDDKTITQNDKIIATFKPTGSSNGIDHYQFALPSGVIVADVSFSGGNNAQNFELFSRKDNFKRVIPIPKAEKTILSGYSADKNQGTLERIVKWLVEKQYL